MCEAAGRHPVGGRVALSILERSGLVERLDDEGQSRVWRVHPYQQRAAQQALKRSDAHADGKTAELRSIIDYAQTGACRRRLILDHFGDDAETAVPPEACCDACVMAGRLRARPDEIPDWADLSMNARIAIGLLDAVRRMAWPVGRMTMSKILAGSQAKGMEKYTRHPYFGRLQTMGQAEVDRLYKQLLLKGYLRLGGGEFPVVELTPIGEQARAHRESIDLEVKPFAAMSRTRDSASTPRADIPLDADAEALFESLREWRTEQARERAVPPYVVFNDRVLRTLAATRPRTAAALLDVPGIGPGKQDMYGDDLLRILAAG